MLLSTKSRNPDAGKSFILCLRKNFELFWAQLLLLLTICFTRVCHIGLVELPSKRVMHVALVRMSRNWRLMIQHWNELSERGWQTIWISSWTASLLESEPIELALNQLIVVLAQTTFVQQKAACFVHKVGWWVVCDFTLRWQVPCWVALVFRDCCFHKCLFPACLTCVISCGGKWRRNFCCLVPSTGAVYDFAV